MAILYMWSCMRHGTLYLVSSVVVNISRSELVLPSHSITSSRQSPRMSAERQGVFFDVLHDCALLYCPRLHFAASLVSVALRLTISVPSSSSS